MASASHQELGTEPNFRNLFRLLDDFSQVYHEGTQGLIDRAATTQRTPRFTPRFDLTETDEAYQLHGELPGVKKDAITIDFVDPQTIVVAGDSRRLYSTGPGQPVVADEEHALHVSTGAAAAAEDKSNAVPLRGKADDKPAAAAATATKGHARFWVAERSVGHFSRSFLLRARVDHDAVTASLEDGILTVTVPKAKKHETKRIAVQ